MFLKGVFTLFPVARSPLSLGRATMPLVLVLAGVPVRSRSWISFVLQLNTIIISETPLSTSPPLTRDYITRGSLWGCLPYRRLHATPCRGLKSLAVIVTTQIKLLLSPSPGSSRWPERERFGEERDDLNDLIMMLSRIFITYSMGRVND